MANRLDSAGLAYFWAQTRPYPNAAAHNAIYRGKCLGTYVTAAQYAAIAAGTFDDMYIGDYWTMGGNDWVICHFDYYLNTGPSYSMVTKHHLVIMPRNVMTIPEGTALYGTSGTLTFLMGENSTESSTAFRWNATSSAPEDHTTNGGYKYSRMRTIIMKAANTIVNNLFPSHVEPICALYPNIESATADGQHPYSMWFANNDQNDIGAISICDLPNETMVFGKQIGYMNANTQALV